MLKIKYYACKYHVLRYIWFIAGHQVTKLCIVK